jgi:hypothetical protein
LAASLLATLVLVLAGSTGAAFAGGGHGHGGGGDHGSWSSGHAWGGDNSQGVKPSNSTKHDTYAQASSDQTKQYGNGKTAGQIATRAGDGNATLHGPGNSQPHKTACAGHEVDVHALKSHGSRCGGQEAAVVQQAKQAQSTKKPCPKKSGVSAAQGEKTQKVEEHPAPVIVTQAKAESVSTWAKEHVTICHATGSATNAYVRISPSAAGVFHGHMGHQEGRDIVPPFVWNGQTYSENWDATGQAIWNAGCAVPAAAQVQAVAVTTTAPPAPAAPAAVAPAAPAAPAAGGVKGATATLAPATHRTAAAPVKAEPQGGVLGATTRLGSAVSGTRLPFTGLPLWIFAAVAAGLILVGAAVRRSSHDRV